MKQLLYSVYIQEDIASSGVIWPMKFMKLLFMNKINVNCYIHFEKNTHTYTLNFGFFIMHGILSQFLQSVSPSVCIKQLHPF